MSKPGDAETESSGRSETIRLEGRLLSVARELSIRDRLVARDEQALVELIGVATPWLLGLTQAMLTDRDEAEDVVQEAFTILWTRIHLIDTEAGGIIPWLLRITRNRAIDRLRARKRWHNRRIRLETHSLDADTTVPAGEPDESAHPGWHVHESVHAALRALPEDQRHAVGLAYFKGLTHSEIAVQLGIPIGTVKTRLRLAFDKLRVALAPIKDWVT